MDDSIIYFSIIIPIYNVEKYLKKCVNSILKQEYKNFEVILVDDGSPDNCPKICDEYKMKDSRIKVIHKQNGGLSSARNEGMKKAIGDYLIFVDSDDYWNSSAALTKIYEKIISLHSRVDVLIYNNVDHSCISNEDIICNRNYDEKKMETFEKYDVLKYLFQNNLFPGAAWVTVTRRKLLIDNNIFFIEGIKAEDIDWLLNVFLKADSYSAVNMAFYVYLKNRNNSITGTADMKSIDDILYILQLWIIKLGKYPNKEIKNYIYGYLSKHYLCALLIEKHIKKIEKKMLKPKLKKYKFLLKYNNSILVKCCYYLPLELLCIVLNIFYKWKRK